MLDETLVYLGGVEGTTTRPWIWTRSGAGAWMESASTLPLTCFFSAFAMFQGDAYLVGGVDCETGIQRSADRLASFSESGALPMGRSTGSLVVHRDALFYVGGGGGPEVLRSDDGATWATAGTLPDVIAGGAVFSFTPQP